MRITKRLAVGVVGILALAAVASAARADYKAVTTYSTDIKAPRGTNDKPTVAKVIIYSKNSRQRFDTNGAIRIIDGATRKMTVIDTRNKTYYEVKQRARSAAFGETSSGKHQSFARTLDSMMELKGTPRSRIRSRKS